MTQYDHYLMFRVGQIHAMVKQMHGKICANPPEAQASKSFMPKGMFAEVGRMLARAMVSQAMGWIITALGSLGSLWLALRTWLLPFGRTFFGG